MKKQKILLIIFIVFFILLILFFLINYKTKNNGNNISKFNGNIKDYILNISSYEAEIEVIVESNKTTNKYILKQLYCKPNVVKQIVKEPSNIENLTVIYDGKNIKLENTNLGLSKIYENYQYINKNTLWLSSFIENYNEKSEVLDTENEVIIENNNKYNNYNVKQILYVDKSTKLPIKMEVYDNNKNAKIYIKYNEIKLNNISRNQIVK